MKRAFLFLVLSVAPLAAQEQTKVVKAIHRPAEHLSRLLFMSHSFTREFNTITLRGTPEAIKAAEAAIQQYDTPRRQAEFFIRVIQAGMPAPAPDDATDLVPAELKSVLRYSRYSLRDSAILRGMEADRLQIALGGNLTGKMTFHLREAQPSATLEVAVNIDGPSTLIKTKDGEVTTNPTLLQTTTTVKSGETVVLGASKMQSQSGSALIVLLTAKLLP